MVCSETTEPNVTLICDGCDGEVCFACVDPPVTAAPPGDWFCAACERKTKLAKLKREGINAAAAAVVAARPVWDCTGDPGASWSYEDEWQDFLCTDRDSFPRGAPLPVAWKSSGDDTYVNLGEDGFGGTRKGGKRAGSGAGGGGGRIPKKSRPSL
jgi:hypothetical protein